MKKGFTLIELLVVIVIIGAIATLVLPGLLNNYTKALAKIMKTEENLLADATSIAIKDYCNSPISSKHRLECKYSSDTGKGLIREKNGMSYICIQTLRDYGYYDNELVYEKTSCRGAIKVELNSDKRYVNPEAYIYCGADYDYDYVTSEDITEYEFDGCE